MKKTYLFAMLGILLLMVIVLPNQPPSQAVEPTTGRIYGYTYQSNGWMLLPVPFVQVTAGGIHVTSDLVGYYEIDELPLDQVYSVRAEKSGFQNISTQVELTQEHPAIQVDFILSIKSDMTKSIALVYQVAGAGGFA